MSKYKEAIQPFLIVGTMRSGTTLLGRISTNSFILI